jgi:cell division protein FtsW (lipid II flippase)
VPEPTSAPGREPVPTPVRVAVVVLALLAVLLLVGAALNAIGWEVVLDRFEEQGQDRATAARTLLLFTSAYAVIGVGALLAAVFLPRRRSWARAVGLLVTSLLLVLTLVPALLTGGVAPTSLLVLVLATAGLTSLLARPTREWLATAPGG